MTVIDINVKADELNFLSISAASCSNLIYFDECLTFIKVFTSLENQKVFELLLWMPKG